MKQPMWQAAAQALWQSSSEATFLLPLAPVRQVQVQLGFNEAS